MMEYENNKPTMFVIKLGPLDSQFLKARNNPKLVRKPIMVQGQHGTFQRMAWVLPEEAKKGKYSIMQGDLFEPGYDDPEIAARQQEQKQAIHEEPKQETHKEVKVEKQVEISKKPEEQIDGAGKKKDAGAKKEFPYKVYHDTLSDAVSETLNNLADKGLYVDKDDLFNEVMTGPAKPGIGKTNKYMLALYDKDGNPAKKIAHFQVYGLENGKYELNMYTTPLKERDYFKKKGDIWNGAEVNNANPGEEPLPEGLRRMKTDPRHLDKDGKKLPFEETTFIGKKTYGPPKNTDETVEDILTIDSGTAAKYAGSDKYEDIDKFQLDAAKWAYNNDIVGGAPFVLAAYKNSLKNQKEKEPALAKSIKDPNYLTLAEIKAVLPIDKMADSPEALNRLVEGFKEDYKGWIAKQNGDITAQPKKNLISSFLRSGAGIRWRNMAARFD
jgi:hypothetical protein